MAMKHLRIIQIALLLTAVSCDRYYERGKALFEEGDYAQSRMELKLVDSNNSKFQEAQLLLSQADSLIQYDVIQRNVKIQQKYVQDSLNIIEQRENHDSLLEVRLDSLKWRLMENVQFLKENTPIENSSVDVMVLKLAYYATLGVDITTAIRLGDADLKRLAQEGLVLLRDEQEREFPLMRKKYSEHLNGESSQHDVSVGYIGNKNKILVIKGKNFVFEERAYELHEILLEKLKEFRFDAVEYHWSYEYEDKVTIEVESHKDSWIGMPVTK